MTVQGHGRLNCLRLIWVDRAATAGISLRWGLHLRVSVPAVSADAGLTSREIS